VLIERISERRRGPAAGESAESPNVTWSDAVVHTVQNVGKSEGHVLRIEMND
jgi:hypothetical protein